MTGALARIADGLATGRLIPYLGPETLLLGGTLSIPASSRALAELLSAKHTVPARARGNMWASAQFIETRRHRQTLSKLMADIFAPPTPPNPLHAWLAGLALPLIVDAWYDDAMAAALSGSWGQIQAVTRNGKHEDIWYRPLRPDGATATAEEADSWTTILYKPHGAVKPNGEFLLSDSDYVEVLTEIDIQTPIPPLVQARRKSRGFVFLGCRFRDQMERTFARQIMKRSAGPHFAVLAGETTRNEQRFLEEMAIERIDLPLGEAVSQLTR
ncbi:MAG TPA: SIR2 family protein [Rhizomicrobium sp.]